MVWWNDPGWPDEWRKNRPKCSPTFFGKKIINNFYREKIVKKVSKGEKSGKGRKFAAA
jgi:hypothetical protein